MPWAEDWRCTPSLLSMSVLRDTVGNDSVAVVADRCPFGRCHSESASHGLGRDAMAGVPRQHLGHPSDDLTQELRAIHNLDRGFVELSVQRPAQFLAWETNRYREFHGSESTFDLFRSQLTVVH